MHTAILPAGSHDLASTISVSRSYLVGGGIGFMGQFCEMQGDIGFTVEYSIRSGQLAVCGPLGLKQQPPSVYKGSPDPRVLYRAFMALHEFNT